jgi:hypothetical protein
MRRKYFWETIIPLFVLYLVAPIVIPVWCVFAAYQFFIRLWLRMTCQTGRILTVMAGPDAVWCLPTLNDMPGRTPAPASLMFFRGQCDVTKSQAAAQLLFDSLVGSHGAPKSTQSRKDLRTMLQPWERTVLARLMCRHTKKYGIYMWEKVVPFDVTNNIFSLTRLVTKALDQTNMTRSSRQLAVIDESEITAY